MIEVKVSTVRDFVSGGEIVNFVIDNLGFSCDEGMSVSEKVKSFLKPLREDLCVVVETGYVDSIYRDCYYNFYSRKHKHYSRDCVRLSFFEPSGMIDGLVSNRHIVYSEEIIESLQSGYRGFLIIRPLVNGCIGRNCLDVGARIQQDILISKSKIESSCLGLKLCVNGFPHSSQDGEYLSCAETTVWEIMEYYGNKYSCYKPILPSAMLNALSNYSYQRQTPTVGLRYDQMSLLLKQQGFESVVYDRENPMFKELFICYVESGFPLAVGLSNEKGMGHAVVCIGRGMIERSSVVICTDIKIGAVYAHYYKWNNNVRKIIFNDDNFPPYQQTVFDDPLGYYTSSYFENAQISYFVVPLPKKVFLDGESAIKASDFLSKNYLRVPDGSYVRTFLASCRSFREHLAKTAGLDNLLKNLMLRIELPKFIWITEIAQEYEFLHSKVSGLILLDATGDINDQFGGFSSMLWVCYDKKFIFYDKKCKGLKQILLPLQPVFEEYSNLK